MSPSIPSLAVDCGNLQNPENGLVNLVNTTFWSLATYECDSGYELVGGNVSRVCESNGMWSGDEPLCNSELYSIPYSSTEEISRGNIFVDLKKYYTQEQGRVIK